MNLHPIFVHFPIAMLSMYSLFEIIKLKRVLEKPYWSTVKFTLLTIGVLMSLITMTTGLIDKQLYVGTSTINLITVHQWFAITTAVFFALVWIIYLSNFTKINSLYKLNRVYHVISEKGLGIIVGLIGLTLITVTGALGGSLVYGADADPFVKIIYKILRLFLDI